SLPLGQSWCVRMSESFPISWAQASRTNPAIHARLGGKGPPERLLRSANMDAPGMVEAAVRAALAGAEVILRAGPEPESQVAVEGKGRSGDYVTEVDLASERAVAEVLRAETGLPVVGEEEGGPRAERYWVVDPLDGTTNFVHGFPIVGVSVALVDHARPV